MHKCNHEWRELKTKDGRKDKLCIKCGKKAMQGQLAIKSTADTKISISQPMARKQIDIPHYNGEKTVIVKVYKDELIKELYKGLNISNLNSIKR